MNITRKQVVIGLSVLIGLLLIGYGVTLAFPRLINPYAGLTTTMEVQMDDGTRNLVLQRLETAKASIAAYEASGEKVDMALYQVIAEQERLLGNLVASREAYETYLQLNPISYTAQNSYGAILEAMGDYEKALVAYGTAIEGAQIEEYYRDYADLLATQFPDRTDEYKAILDEAYANIGQTPWSMIALGDWYFDHNDCELGRDHYQVAKTLAPGNESVQKDLDEKYTACTK